MKGRNWRFLIGAMLFGLGFWLGKYVSDEVLLGLYDDLVMFSTIIFAILGVWLAVAFPGVIEGIYEERGFFDLKEKIARARKLLCPMYITATVIFLCLFIKFLFAPLQSLVFVANNTLDNRIMFALSLVFLGLLSYSLLLTLSPSLQLIFHGEDKFNKERRKRALLSQNKDINK